MPRKPSRGGLGKRLSSYFDIGEEGSMATEQYRINRDHAQGQTKNQPPTEDVAVAAYYIAERRGFAGDQQLDDWLSAERELGSKSPVPGEDEIAARGLVEEDIAPDEIN